MYFNETFNIQFILQYFIYDILLIFKLLLKRLALSEQ